MTTQLTTTCCIAGGGPAGMMAGFLLARAGVDVTVLEKHGDFFRDFRGDTVHPSTLQIMDELGLLDEFLKRPHDEVRELSGQIGQDHLVLADFSRLKTRCNFIALMPQWDFLDFIADHAKTLPTFHLQMNCEATGLIEADSRVTGVHTTQGDITATLTIAADGRHSALRAAAGLEVQDFAAPMDVLWFRLSRKPTDSAETFGHAEAGRLMIMLNRTTYWQCAYVIAKGSAEPLRRQPISTFHAAVETMAPVLHDRLGEIASWKDVKLLTVTVDRLKRWCRPGFLAIGDAAHAMSPIGGVGINLAIQDAVATANLLAAPLRSGVVAAAHLEAVQKRREFPVKLVQRAQIAIQRQVLGRLLTADKPLRAPWLLRVLAAIPPLRAVPAYLVGIGVRPEHVRVTGSD
jgi:2-polyprenyl-6-methoxyphenol hydroxylase-like FAD-dependent oxidoreductase